MQQREKFASRLGFLLISAGCAIGLGNVWRFPYITGKYGGAAFVLVYLTFLVILGLPVMVMEFAVGRASQKSCAKSFEVLAPGTKWRHFKWWGFIGCYVLMMFYTTVGGWMLSYMVKSASGTFTGLDAGAVAGVFDAMLANPAEMIGWMLVVVVLCFFVCSMGLQKGVERITKVMMACLFVILVVLCVRSVTLPGAGAGFEFYLVPDFSRMFQGSTTAERWASFGEAVYAAMGQAFFTLSLGISAIDTVWSALDDQEGFEAEVRNARARGVSGKSCIHPSQVPVVHRLYTPDEEEVAHARRVMEAMRAAEQAGAGVFTVDGKMVDAPVIAKARRVLLQIGEEV